MCRAGRAAIALAVLLAVSASLGLLGLARAAQAAKTIHDGVFSPEQVTDGAEVWENVCAECHPMDVFGPDYMIGWAGASAGELFDQLRATMPYENPGTLEDQEYADVMVFLFSINGVKPGDEKLPTDLDVLYEITIDGPFQWSGAGR